MPALIFSCDHTWHINQMPHPNQLCGTKENLQPNIEMGEVLKLNGEKLSLKESLKEAVQALEEDGCLDLNGATNLTTFPVGITSTDSVTAEITLNKVKLSGDLSVEK